MEGSEWYESEPTSMTIHFADLTFIQIFKIEFDKQKIMGLTPKC